MNTPTPPPTPQFQQFDLVRFASKLDFVVPEAVLSDLKAATKFDAIQQLVAALARAGAIPTAQETEVLAAIVHREELGSTAIGRGVAVPHARHETIPRVVGAIGFSRAGIDFDSLDRKPVHLLVLVLSPADAAAAAQNLCALQQVVTELKAGVG